MPSKRQKTATDVESRLRSFDGPGKARFPPMLQLLEQLHFDISDVGLDRQVPLDGHVLQRRAGCSPEEPRGSRSSLPRGFPRSYPREGITSEAVDKSFQLSDQVVPHLKLRLCCRTIKPCLDTNDRCSMTTWWPVAKV